MTETTLKPEKVVRATLHENEINILVKALETARYHTLENEPIQKGYKRLLKKLRRNQTGDKNNIKDHRKPSVVYVKNPELENMPIEEEKPIEDENVEATPTKNVAQEMAPVETELKTDVDLQKISLKPLDKFPLQDQENILKYVAEETHVSLAQEENGHWTISGSKENIKAFTDRFIAELRSFLIQFRKANPAP
jgi:hypothetical protein